MARVTVEDCIDKVDNRFDLVLLAAHRARMISSGSPITVDRDNDKNPVVSLREIADQTIAPEDLREELVHSLQKFVEVDEPEPDTIPLIGSAGASVDADDTEVAVERMTEEELLKGLEATWQVIQDAVSLWSIAELAVQVHDIDDDGVDQIYTRQWVLWHLIEHDLHHGGELSFTLGMHGLTGIAL